MHVRVVEGPSDQRSLCWPYSYELLSFSFAILVIIAAIYVYFDIAMYADGALFSFGLATPDPWAHTWSNFSGRVTAYLLTIVIPHIVAQSTGDIYWGIKTYSMILGLLPILSIYLTARLNGWRGAITQLCAFSTVSINLYTVFFPTEISLTHALFWPALAYSCSDRRGGPLTPLIYTAFALTHEAAIILLPAIACISTASGDKRDRRLVTWWSTAFAIAAWFALKWLLPPSSAAVRTALSYNAIEFFRVSNVVDRLPVSIALAWILFLAILCMTKRKISAVLTTAIIPSLILLLALLIIPDVDVYARWRYAERTLVFFWLFAVCIAISAIQAYQVRIKMAAARTDTGSMPGDTKPVSRLINVDPVFIGRALLGMACIAGTGHLIEAIRFANGWVRFQATLQDIGARTNQENANGLVEVPQEFFWTTGGQWRLSWDWAAPYHSLLLSQMRGGYYLIYPNVAKYSPFTCEEIKAIERAGSLIDPRRIQLLRTYICEVYEVHR